MKNIHIDVRLPILLSLGIFLISPSKIGAVTTGKNAVLRNTNRLPLEQVDAGVLAPFHIGSIAFQKGRYLAVGSRTIYEHKPSTSPSLIAVSEDAKTWTVTHTNRLGVKALATDGERIVAVGDYGAILVSPDGYQWQQGRSTGTNYLQSVAFGDGLWVAVGNQGAIVTSHDAIDWTVRDDPQYVQIRLHLTAVTYGAGRFVAVGGEHAGRSISSTDGITWIPGRFTDSVFITDPPLDPEGHRATTRLLGVAYGNNRFVTGGGAGRTFVSTDGVDWMRSTTEDAQWTLTSISYIQGRFLIPIDDGVLSSRDGFNWIRDSELPRTAQRLQRIIFHEGCYVGVGFSGYLSRALGSKPVIDTVSETPASVILSFSGGSADRSTVEVTPSLVSPIWTRIGEVATPNGEGTFEDVTASNTTSRFYRVVER